MADIRTFDIDAYIKDFRPEDQQEDSDLLMAIAACQRALFADLLAHAAAPPRRSPIIEIAGKSYKRDARGALMPIESIRPFDLLKDEEVYKIVGFASEASQRVARFGRHTYSDIASLAALVEQEYEVKLIRGEKGNVTLTSYDGLLKVQVHVQDRLEFGPELQAAKKLVDECLTEWAADSRAEIRALVTRAFQVDQEGRINRSEIFMLMRAAIDDPRWIRAMEAVKDSIRVIGSKSYLRFAERDAPDGEWRPITIDLAAA